MNIKEVETRTGLTRANIRFYEQEGLLTPRRRDNGYRDYSEADVAALEKIRLLRRLRLDLDSIRALQAGDLTLERAMDRQLDALAEDRAAVERACRVCRALRDSGTDYRDLNPERWLTELDEAPAGPHLAALPFDRPVQEYCPWRRYFARTLDLAICRTLWSAVQLLVLGWLPGTGGGRAAASVVGWGMAIFLSFFFEPLLLSTWGTTPGKALFRLKIRRPDGGKLTFRQAAERLLWVYRKGTCWNIPLVELWFLYKSYRRCEQGDAQPWEEEGGFCAAGAWKPWQGLAFAAALAVLVLSTWPMTAQAMLPKHRGKLTCAEFIEDFNAASARNGYSFELDENGQPALRQEDEGSVTIWLCGEPVLPELTYTEQDGVLRSISFVWETDSAAGMSELPSGWLQMLWLTLVTSRRSVNAFNYYFVLRQAAEEEWIPSEPYLALEGIVLRGAVTALEGYQRGQLETAGLLIPEETALSFRCRVEAVIGMEE